VFADFPYHALKANLEKFSVIKWTFDSFSKERKCTDLIVITQFLRYFKWRFWAQNTNYSRVGLNG